MNTKQLNDILTLFTLLILADGKVYGEETRTMGRQLFQIFISMNTGIMFTPEMAREWFRSHRQPLSALLEGRDRAAILKVSITKLAGLDMEFKLKLYGALVKVSRADDDFHEAERTLVKQAAQIWGIEDSLADLEIAEGSGPEERNA